MKTGTGENAEKEKIIIISFLHKFGRFCHFIAFTVDVCLKFACLGSYINDVAALRIL